MPSSQASLSSSFSPRPSSADSGFSAANGTRLTGHDSPGSGVGRSGWATWTWPGGSPEPIITLADSRARAPTPGGGLEADGDGAQRARPVRREVDVYWHNMNSDHNNDGDTDIFVGMRETFACDVAEYLLRLASFLGETRGRCRLRSLTCTAGSIDVIIDTEISIRTLVSIMRRCGIYLPPVLHMTDNFMSRFEQGH